jgi:hypothetical protein
MSERSSHQDPPEASLREAFVCAYEAAHLLSGRIGLSEDHLQDGATKWWTRVNRRPFPPYLLEDGHVSVRWLTGWIIKSAQEARSEAAAKERRPASFGFTVVSDSVVEGAALSTPDDLARPVDDLVLGRLDARSKLDDLGGFDEVDAVLRYRALDYTYEEIGAALDVAPGAARVRMSRAVSRLASKLEQAA